MLTIFNGNEGHPIARDDYYIRQLASGLDEIIVNINIRDDIYKYVREEAVIRDRDQNTYLIKQIDAGEETAKIVARIDLDDWKNEIHFKYSNNSATVAKTVTDVLPDGWTVLDHSGVTKRRTIPTSDTTIDYNVTGYEVLEDCAKVYDVRFRFDTALKRVHIINPFNYESMGAFATRDLNLKALNYKGKSEGFITRLYAEGADGLTFASINNGKAYVENKTYADKVVCGFWKDDRYTDKQSLLDDAQKRLDALAKPVQSYDCDVLDLANTNPEVYGFEDFSLFQVVTLVDDAKGIRTDYQVVERWEYPYYPVNNKVILSLSTPSIQSAIQTVFETMTQTTSGFQQIIQSAIANATSLITGNKGGYLVLHDSDGDGMPDELLIMNTPDISTATKIWRWNQAGLGYSNNGYNGTYGLAINMDGSIIGDYIAANTIDGASIRADTITAAQLTTEAKESLAALHYYLSPNIFSDISLWTHGTTVPAPYYETINDKTYLVLDGTNLAAYATTNWARTLTDVRGNFDVNVHFVYHIDREVEITESQRFPHIRYCGYDGKYYVTYSVIGAQTIPANTDFTWDIKLSSNGVDSSKGVEFGFCYIQGCKVYIEELSVYSSVDSYTKAGMDFNARGLTLLAEELDKESNHNYLPYDVMTNLDRWSFNASDGWTIGFETITINGRTVQAIALDATNITVYDSTRTATILTDIIGKPELTFKYHYAFAGSFTISSSTQRSRIRIGSSTGYSSLGTAYYEGGVTYQANTEYTNSQTRTPSVSANYFARKSTVEICAVAGAKVYIYDLELTGTVDAYKKASLSYTADGLDSVVQMGSIISSINQSAESVSINANKINLTGDVNLRGVFTSYGTGSDANYSAELKNSKLTFYNSNIQGSDKTEGGVGPYGVNGQHQFGLYVFDVNDRTKGIHVGAGDATLRNTWLLGATEIGNETGDTCRFHCSGGTTFDWDVRFNGTVRNASGGTQFVSDKRKKRNIKALAIKKAKAFIMGLKPVKYKFIKSISKSNRYHHGFIAQDVKEVMPEDFGIYCENKADDFIGLRYDEFIADMVAVMQDQEKRIEKLENEVKSLKKIAKESNT